MLVNLSECHDNLLKLLNRPPLQAAATRGSTDLGVCIQGRNALVVQDADGEGEARHVQGRHEGPHIHSCNLHLRLWPCEVQITYSSHVKSADNFPLR